MGKVLFVALVDPGYVAATPGPEPAQPLLLVVGFFQSWLEQNWPHYHGNHPTPDSTPNYPNEVQISHLARFPDRRRDGRGRGLQSHGPVRPLPEFGHVDRREAGRRLR